MITFVATDLFLQAVISFSGELSHAIHAAQSFSTIRAARNVKLGQILFDGNIYEFPKPNTTYDVAYVTSDPDLGMGFAIGSGFSNSTSIKTTPSGTWTGRYYYSRFSLSLNL